MSAAAAPDLLPPQFVLRLPSRNSKKDPHSGFILVNATPVPEKGNALRLTPVAPAALGSPPYKLHVSTNNMILGGVFNTWQKYLLLHRTTETPQLVTLTLSAAYRVETPTGTHLSVYDFDHTGVTHFLPPHTRRNIPLTAVPDYTAAGFSPVTVPKPTVTTASPPALSIAPGLPAPTVQKMIDAALKHLPASFSATESANAIALVTDVFTIAGAKATDEKLLLAEAALALKSLAASGPAGGPVGSSAAGTGAGAGAGTAAGTAAPPKKPRKQASPQALPATTVSAHVARQLFELARIRHTECPIIAEELSEGNTAVMPCGHLFSRLGIEESFKKEPKRCPACRTEGRPAFV